MANLTSRTIYKLLSCLLIVCMIVGVWCPSYIAEQTESVFLSDLSFAGAHTSNGNAPLRDVLPDATKSAGGKTFEKAVVLPTVDSRDSYVHFDLNGEYKGVSMNLAVDSASVDSTLDFCIYVDGVLRESVSALAKNTLRSLNIDVSEGNDLVLVVSGNGNAVFAEPILTFADSQPKDKQAIALTALSPAAGTVDCITEASGKSVLIAGSRENNAGITLNKAVLVSLTSSESVIEYEIPDCGAQFFETTIAHDVENSANNSLVYNVYTDKGAGYQSVFTSSALVLDDFYDISVDLSGVKKFKISIKGANGNVAVLGNPVISAYKSHLNQISIPVSSLDLKSDFSVGTDSTTGYSYDTDINGSVIKIGNTQYDSGVCMQPHLISTRDGAANVASLLSYEITGLGATSFSATVGQSSNASSSDGMVFSVIGDGKVLAKSETLSGNKTFNFNVDITGVTLLGLYVDFLNDKNTDIAVWADAYITASGEKVNASTVVVKDITELEHTKFVDYNAEPTINTEADGSNFPAFKMMIGGIEFEHTIGQHPRGDGASSITYDISGLGYTRFSTFFGKRDSWIATGGPHAAGFAIYGDNKLLYESDKMIYGECRYASVDITGVSTLRLEVNDGGDGLSCDSSGWGNPVLQRVEPDASIVLDSNYSQMIPSDTAVITGSMTGIADLNVLVNGEEKPVNIAVDCYGRFSIVIDDFDYSVNNITLQGLRNGEVVAEKNFVLKVAAGKYLDLSDMEFISTTPKGCTVTRGKNFIGVTPQVGDGAISTNNAISVNASEGDSSTKKDITIDISQLGSYTYFKSTVGRDDFGATDGEVFFSVFADGNELAQTKVLRLGEYTTIEAEIPRNTQILTLRVNYISGWGTFADWIEPRLYLDESTASTTAVTAYKNVENESEVISEGVLAIQFKTDKDFNRLTLPMLDIDDNAEIRFYKYVYDIDRSMQGVALYSADGAPADASVIDMEFGQMLSAGEYLIVVAGGAEVITAESDKMVVYCDGTYKNAIAPVECYVDASQSGDVFVSATVPEVEEERSNTATDDERKRAEAVFEGYLNDLSTLPVTLTIADETYYGFGSDFTHVKTDDVTEGEKRNVTVYLKHISGLDFEIRFVYYPNYAAYEWTIYFTNNTDTNSPVVKDIFALDMTVEGDNPYLDTSYGDTCSNSTIPYMPMQEWLVKDKTYTFIPKEERGRSTENVFPYYNFEAGDGGMLLAIGWPGEWRGDITFDGAKTSFKFGQQYFESYLEPGETARSPLAAFILYDGRDIDRATNLWRRWYIDCNMPTSDGEKIEGYVAGGTNQQYSEMINATEDNQIDAIRQYISNGVQLDYWWMDAGWYVLGPEHDGVGSWALTGSWTVDTERFPTEFAGVTAYAEENDVKTLLWFEPERVGYSISELKDDGSTLKKEWLIGYGTDNWDKAGPHYMLDLGNEECREWLVERVMSILEKGGISLYREDFNIYAQQYWTLGDSENRIGITENKSVQGHLAYWDSLLELDPSLVIDSCASGGGRNDLENLRRAIVIHPTDALYFDEEAKQAGSMMMYRWWPYVGTNTGQMTHDSINLYQLRSTYRPFTAYFLNPSSVAKNSSILAQGVEEHNAIRDLYYGDYYQLTDWNISAYKWLSYEFYDESTGKGFVLAYRRQKGTESKKLRLKGLEENGTYLITFVDSGETLSASGSELMNVGIELTLNPLSSALVMIESVLPVVENCDDEDGWTSENQAERVTVDNETAKDGSSIVFKSPESGFKAENHYLATIRKTLDFPVDLSGYSDLSIDLYTAQELKSGKIVVSVATESYHNDTGDMTGINSYEFDCDFDKDNWYTLNIDITEIIDRSDVKYITISWVDESLAAGDTVNSTLDLRIDNISVGEADEPAPPIGPTLGDLDGNGSVTAADALAVLQAAVGKTVLDDTKTALANVDGKGGITAADALLVLQRAVKKIDKFPVENN